MRTSHTSLCNAIRRKLTALNARREKAVRLRAEYEAKVSVKAEEVAALDAQIDLLQATLSQFDPDAEPPASDRKSTRLNSSRVKISYGVFCLKKNTRNRSRLIGHSRLA